MFSPSSQRASLLVSKLLSADVQLPSQTEQGLTLPQEPAKLSAQEVEKVFVDKVPGVRKFLFRQQPGQCVLKFLQIAYKDGFSAFRGTPLEEHLNTLLRSIVHYAYEGKPNAARYLKEVAEAFMDCQAVQARVVERVGLEMRGTCSDFRGLLVALVGDYKTMALKMLAFDRIAQGKAQDDSNPTHYENRLTADVGPLLGLNADDIRLASLDVHASNRFARIGAAEAKKAAERARELFDVAALAQAVASEISSFSDASPQDSMPRRFLEWAAVNLREKHAVFDEETFTRLDVDARFAFAILEACFLGKPDEEAAVDLRRGQPISELFLGEGGKSLELDSDICNSTAQESPWSSESGFCTAQESPLCSESNSSIGSYSTADESPLRRESNSSIGSNSTAQESLLREAAEAAPAAGALVPSSTKLDQSAERSTAARLYALLEQWILQDCAWLLSWTIGCVDTLGDATVTIAAHSVDAKPPSQGPAKLPTSQQATTKPATPAKLPSRKFTKPQSPKAAKDLMNACKNYVSRGVRFFDNSTDREHLFHNMGDKETQQMTGILPRC